MVDADTGSKLHHFPFPPRHSSLVGQVIDGCPAMERFAGEVRIYRSAEFVTAGRKVCGDSLFIGVVVKSYTRKLLSGTIQLLKWRILC